MKVKHKPTVLGINNLAEKEVLAMSIKPFAYYMPSRIESGNGISEKIGELIKEKDLKA
jgi:hypothetical protein